MNYAKNREEAKQAFSKLVTNFPLWKILETGTNFVAAANLSEEGIPQTTKIFTDSMNNLKDGYAYTVNMYRTGRKGHTNANANFTFVNQTTGAVIGGDTRETPAPDVMPPARPAAIDAHEKIIQPVAYTERIGLSDHISLIQAKASAEAKITYLEAIISDQAKKISTLETEAKEADAEIMELENLLDEYEAEEAEEEEAVSGTEKELTIESALASVIKENGASIIENLSGKKVEGDIELTEEEGEVKINGITPDIAPKYSLDQLNREMLAIDPDWNKHLLKLVLIGQKKPNTFKMLIKKLEEF